MSPTGADQRRLTTSPLSDRHPTFSPDGATIAYAAQPALGTRAIGAMDADGANQRTLLEDGAVESHPAFAPDGSAVAFDRDRGRTRVLLLRTGSTTSPLDVGAGNNYAPTWGPDPAAAVPGAAAPAAPTARVERSSSDRGALHFKVDGRRRQAGMLLRKRLRFTGLCDRDCTVRFTGTFSFGAKRPATSAGKRKVKALRIRSFALTFRAGVVRAKDIRLSKSAMRRVRAAVRAHRQIRLRLTGRALDARGFRSLSTKTFRLLR